MVTEEFVQWAIDAVAADLNELNAAVNLEDFVVVADVVVIEVEMVVRIWAHVVVELDFWAAVAVVAIVDAVIWNYFELEIVAVAVVDADDVVVEENLINHYFDTTKLALDFELLYYY